MLLLFAAIIPAAGQENNVPETEKAKGTEWIPRIINEDQKGIYKSLLSTSVYPVTPGDIYKLEITFQNEPVGYFLTVNKDHTIEVPYIGILETDGLEYSELRETVVQKLKNTIRLNHVDFFFSSPAQFEVTVTGRVNNPGIVIANTLMVLGDAITIAGGFREDADTRTIEVSRQRGEQLVVDITKFNQTGDFKDNPRLKIGDKIKVSSAEKIVSITGQVLDPDQYVILPHETISDLIRIAGGFPPDAQKNKIQIRRYKKDGTYFMLHINFEEEGNFNLFDGDKVHVFSASHNSPVVTVEGALYGKPYQGVKPIEVPLDDFVLPSSRVINERITLQVPVKIKVILPHYYGMTLYDILQELGGPTPYAIVDKCKIMREGSESGIDFNIQELWQNAEKAKEITIEPNDHVIVPMSKNFVMVSGEVFMPGPYPYETDAPVSDYLVDAGGIMETGNKGYVFLLDGGGGKLRKLRLKDQINPGDIIYVEKLPKFKISDFAINSIVFFTAVTSLGLTIYNIIQLSRQ